MSFQSVIVHYVFTYMILHVLYRYPHNFTSVKKYFCPNECSQNCALCDVSHHPDRSVQAAQRRARHIHLVDQHVLCARCERRWPANHDQGRRGAFSCAHVIEWPERGPGLVPFSLGWTQLTSPERTCSAVGADCHW